MLHRQLKLLYVQPSHLCTESLGKRLGSSPQRGSKVREKWVWVSTQNTARLELGSSSLHKATVWVHFFRQDIIPPADGPFILWQILAIDRLIGATSLPLLWSDGAGMVKLLQRPSFPPFRQMEAGGRNWAAWVRQPLNLSAKSKLSWQLLGKGVEHPFAS